ncbi:MAG TPA: hypothetical protein VMM18_00850 [Gemmatimonadaceae bacterium]|nr:hypothetical protein [Gemmatimonadaceae bacterium]
MRRAAVLALCVGLALPAAAQQAPGETYVLIVTGVGGEAHYSRMFHEWAIAFGDAARDRHGVSPEHITYLGENTQRAPDRIADRSTREVVERELTRLARLARAGDRVLVVLFGHGAGSGPESRFNLPGPDLTAAEWAALLGRFSGPTVGLVNAASASGDFVAALSGERRIIITATKSAQERNEARFGRFFVDAFARDVADVDKDGRVSLLEAFDYARREVARTYEEEGALLTEHAQLDDDGDGTGTAAPDGLSGDGRLARAFHLNSTARVIAGADPRLRALYEEKQAIETRLDELRRRKDSLSAADYEQRLEDLLVALAEKNLAIRELEARRP